MTSGERVRVTVDDRGVADVAMVRTDKMNAIDGAMFKGLIDAVEQVRNDKRVRVVVLHGEGRAFCAGLDMASFKEMGSGKTSGSLGDILSHSLDLGRYVTGSEVTEVSGALETFVKQRKQAWKNVAQVHWTAEVDAKGELTFHTDV